jgi:K+-sensing histidine kinase KdpD
MGEDKQEHRPQIRRRVFLIDRHFQLKWTLLIVMVGVVISSGLGSLVVWVTRENTELLSMDALFADRIAEYDSHVFWYLIAFVVVMALALAVWGILLTHRVAGPIRILSRGLQMLAMGQRPRTRKLRKRDDLQGLFRSYVFMINEVQVRQRAEIELIEAALVILRGSDFETTKLQTLEDLLAEKKAFVSSGKPS